MLAMQTYGNVDKQTEGFILIHYLFETEKVKKNC